MSSDPKLETPRSTLLNLKKYMFLYIVYFFIEIHLETIKTANQSKAFVWLPDKKERAPEMDIIFQ